MLARAFSFVTLGFGADSSLVDDVTFRSTRPSADRSGSPDTFTLIYAGAIVIMYFAIASDGWPHLTGRALMDLSLMRAQLWLWFVGKVVRTFPWRWVGILGMPRRMACWDYRLPALSAEASSVAALRFGGSHPPRLGVLRASPLLIREPEGRREVEVRALSLRDRGLMLRSAVPTALNGFGTWVALMVALTITNSALRSAARPRPGGAVPAVYVGAQR